MIGRIYYKLKNLVATQPKQPRILEMIFVNKGAFKENQLNKNYNLRQFDFLNPLDHQQFHELMKVTEMGTCPLDYWCNHILPGGFFVIEFIPENKIIASCFASHHPSNHHPFAGNLGWLAVNAEHRGHQLGDALVNEVVKRLLNGGYKHIYLGTHDFRLAAIKIYLNQGWRPFIYDEGMVERWEKIFKNLKVGQEKAEWKFAKNFDFENCNSQ
jgi:GNAT superfamily N-acetyltransferase